MPTLLAVSGQNVVLLGMLVLGAGMALGLPLRAGSIVVALGLAIERDIAATRPAVSAVSRRLLGQPIVLP